MAVRMKKHAKFEVAPQTYTKYLEDEIQEIFQVLYDDPKNTMLATDESRISDVSREKIDIERVKKHLGINIEPSNTFVEAALKLISARKKALRRDLVKEHDEPITLAEVVTGLWNGSYPSERSCVISSKDISTSDHVSVKEFTLSPAATHALRVTVTLEDLGEVKTKKKNAKK